MKVIHIISLIVVLFATYSSGQRCLGGPVTSVCAGDPNIGQTGANCVARILWFYNTAIRQCRRMLYLGCGGNDNRWCSYIDCKLGCRRGRL
ncbi:hypothetical protein FF38_12134 [Lucilia cuprina]|uniref:BPTI/Kunitz inhibitor domain-containing protein n=1 Tax=Lucilia cuprina TaxID=7375 RepID=A0A0L0BPN1_LUCCU|nr:hypothetical protein FF38_12134 [Lucilia cuprina]